MKQLTAIDWLYQELTKTWYDKKSGQELLIKAKQMEKEQIEDAYTIGSYDTSLKEFNPNKYYNETYTK